MVERWILDTSEYPNPSLAKCAALSFVGKLCDRKVAGPVSNNVTLLFLIAIALTGIGKQKPLQAPKVLLGALGGEHADMLGAGDFQSVQGIEALVTLKPNSLNVVDEFGTVLSRLMAEGNTHSNSITSQLNPIWGNGWIVLPMSVRAHSKELTPVIAPMPAIFGASTPMEFYEALGKNAVGGGFINRLLCFQAGPKPLFTEPTADPLDPPAALMRGIREVVRWIGPEEKPQGAVLHPAKRLSWGPGAFDLWRALVNLMAVFDGLSPSEVDLRQRVAEQALRVATVIAAGRMSATVDRADIMWGTQIAEASLAFVQDGLEKYGPSLDDRRVVCNEIEEFTRARGFVSDRDVYRKWRRRQRFGNNLVDSALDTLEKQGLIKKGEHKPWNGGPASRGWLWVGC